MGRLHTILAGALAGLVAATVAQAADPHNPYYQYQLVQDLAKRPLPLVATFTRGDEVLVFAAGKHMSTPGSARLKAIAAAFEKARPAVVIVEGFPTAAGQNPPQLLADKKSEAGYAANLALAHHVPFIGGEPTDVEKRDAILFSGYVGEDVMFTFLVRDMEQALRSGELHGLHDKKLPQVYDQHAGSEARTLGLRQLSFADFETRYKTVFGVDYARDAQAGRRADPDTGSSVGRVLQVETIMRDRHIYNTIMQTLMSRKRVLIVYGGEHWKTLCGPLGTALGLPRFQ